jgi:pimeloyl-ACP methyl ester carboxylesterase
MQTEHVFTVPDGLRLFFRELSPERETAHLPVLCLHGLTRNGRDFSDIAAHLSQRYRVIVPDVRGRGFSDRDPDPSRYQPPVYAQDMWHLLDRLGIARCIIIGTSMGGIIAMIMAAQQPQRIAGIVLNDVGPELDAAGLQRIAGYVGERVPVGNWDEAAAACRRINAVALPDFTDADWLQFARNTFREDDSGVPRADYDPAIAQAFGQIDSSDATAKAWQLFELLRQPVLVLRGALSDLLSAAAVAQMQRRHPDLTAVEIPGRGHAPVLNEPASIAALDAFLSRFR